MFKGINFKIVAVAGFMIVAALADGLVTFVRVSPESVEEANPLTRWGIEVFGRPRAFVFFSGGFRRFYAGEEVQELDCHDCSGLVGLFSLGRFSKLATGNLQLLVDSRLLRNLAKPILIPVANHDSVYLDDNRCFSN
jgi:hypothetical protein